MVVNNLSPQRKCLAVIEKKYFKWQWVSIDCYVKKKAFHFARTEYMSPVKQMKYLCLISFLQTSTKERQTVASKDFIVTYVTF